MTTFDLEEFRAATETRDLLRFVTAGSVDDGKSTLIGRLLHDSSNLPEDQVLAVSGVGGIDFARVTDGLEAEREQGITIDVAHRYFATERRAFIIADTPGHEQYTRNMATGASTAQLALILVDAEKGIGAQTRRHAFIASLLGIPRFLIVVNKMDLVAWSESVFEGIRREFSLFAQRLPAVSLSFVPVSARDGDNVVESSDNMTWYHGESVLSHLENVYVGNDRNLIDFRYPIQYVQRHDDGDRGLCGQVTSGRIRVGEDVLVLPSRIRTRVKGVVTYEGELSEVFAGQSVSLLLEDAVDVHRGDMLVRPNNVPHAATSFEAMLVWMDKVPLDQGCSYRILHGCRDVRARVRHLRYRVDVDNLSREKTDTLTLNDIGRVSIEALEALIFDAYGTNPGTGSFVLVDEGSNETVAAGMIIDRLPDKAASTAAPRLVEEDPGLVPHEEREAASGHKAPTLWLTGLSGSGKSSIARGVERRLFDKGFNVYRLDGDNLRSGLTSDLSFTRDDRAENIRRVAEVAHLFNDAGSIVLASLISPYEADRQLARTIVGKARFVEVHVHASLETCEARDPKGLYRQARAGEIGSFTGVSDPYEVPRNPNLVVDTSRATLEESVERVVEFIEPHLDALVTD